MESEIKIKLEPFHEAFLLSDARFPAFVAGIGTGKTYMLLLKAVRWCLTYPGALGVIVRNQFTDLHDSTLNDFKKYFGVDVDLHKEVIFENGSKLMFRHGSETAVLKNINLDFAGIEQAEEFEDDTQFNFLRDRLRGGARKLWNPDGTPMVDAYGKQKTFQQMFIIANRNGHDWIWRRWEYERPSSDYFLVTATTFDNARNLPESFINDQKEREKTEPRHYRRMVLNSADEDLSDDILFKSVDVARSAQLNYQLPSFTRYVAGLDVARYGDDATCLTILAQISPMRWRQVFQEEKRQWSVPQVASWVKDVYKMLPFDTVGVDDVGVGGGVTDLLSDSNKFTTYPFIANEKPNGVCPYEDNKSVGYFKLEDWIAKDYLQILNDIYLHAELSIIKFYYRGDVKHIVGKDVMRRDGKKSPNKAEALMIAVFCAEYQDVGEVVFDVPGVSVQKPLQQYAEISNTIDIGLQTNAVS